MAVLDTAASCLLVQGQIWDHCTCNSAGSFSRRWAPNSVDMRIVRSCALVDTLSQRAIAPPGTVLHRQQTTPMLSYDRRRRTTAMQRLRSIGPNGGCSRCLAPSSHCARRPTLTRVVAARESAVVGLAAVVSLACGPHALASGVALTELSFHLSLDTAFELFPMLLQPHADVVVRFDCETGV